jgi:hypothetical protein
MVIFVDVETLGLKVGINPITGFGAVDSNNTADRFMAEVRVPDGAQICASALNYQEYTPEQVRALHKKSRMDIGDAMRAFVEWYVSHDDQTFAGQNPLELDRPMLIHAAKQADIEVQFGHRSYDLQSGVLTELARTGLTIPIEKKRTAISSDFIQDFFGLPRETKPHVGLGGALWEAEAYSRLVRNENSVQEYCCCALTTPKQKENTVLELLAEIAAQEAAA